MTNKEAQQAYKDGCQIQYESNYCGTLYYERINALVYRNLDGKQIVQAELQECGRKGVTIVDIERIKRREEKKL